MAVKTSFINDNLAHDATEWADYFAEFVSNGVFSKPATGLYVSNPNDLTLSVAPGAAFIDGVRIANTSALSLTIDTTPSFRTDRVVVRLDLSVPEGTITILKGTDGSEAAPALARTGTRKELCICEVTLDSAGISSIYDTRADRSLCGIVQNFLGNVDATGLFRNYQREFDSVIRTMERSISEVDAETAGLYGSAGRQGFINPTFAVNQRGSSSYGLTGGSTYTFDRWLARIGGASASAAVVVSREQDGERLALKVANKAYVAGSTAAASCIAQNVEGGVRTFCSGGRRFTVSFDAKASAAQRLAVEPVQYADASSVGASIDAQVVSLGTSWQRYSLTFEGTVTPTAEQLSDVLKVGFFFAWRGNSDRFGADQDADGTVYLANMQLNEGGAALPCYVRDYGDELERCRRYYAALGFTSLSCGSQNVATLQVVTCPLPLTRAMRAKPTVTVQDRAGNAGTASVETVAGSWRDGLEFAMSDSAADNPVFIVRNTDAASVTRVCFNSVRLDAEIQK